LSTQLHERLAAAIAAVNETNTKLQAHDAAIARLNATIDAVPNLQGDLNALAADDAAAFERFARDGGDEPVIDAKAHDKARIALVAAQAKAAAARTAMAKIEAERAKASAHGVAAQAAIRPLAMQIALAPIFEAAIDEAMKHRIAARDISTKADEALALLAALVDSLPNPSDERREVSILMTELSTKTRVTYEIPPTDTAAIRRELNDAISAVIDANTNENA
jgi:hypothetical protein